MELACFCLDILLKRKKINWMIYCTGRKETRGKKVLQFGALQIVALSDDWLYDCAVIVKLRLFTNKLCSKKMEDFFCVFYKSLTFT